MITNKVKTTELDFTRDDQQQINHFSRLNMQYQDKYRMISMKKEIVNQLDDALTELELCDDDEFVRMKYGDCFFHVKAQHAKDSILKQTQKAKSEVQEYDQIIAETDKKMKK